MPKPRRQFVDTEYGQMHVRVSTPEKATKLPLLCLHQSPKSSWEFIEFMTAVSDDRLVIAPDYPGMGESDKPPAEPHVMIQDYAKTVWEIVDHFGLEYIDVFGNHTGSLVAVEMAWQRPNHIHKLVLVSAVSLTEEEEADFKNTFLPVPLDEEGTRFAHLWKMIKEHHGPNIALEMMAESLAESLRGGEAYEWGHQAAFTYNKKFVKRATEIGHTVTIINPDDVLSDLTIRSHPLFKNGKLENHPQWGQGFLKIYANDVARTVKVALDTC